MVRVRCRGVRGRRWREPDKWGRLAGVDEKGGKRRTNGIGELNVAEPPRVLETLTRPASVKDRTVLDVEEPSVSSRRREETKTHLSKQHLDLLLVEALGEVSDVKTRLPSDVDFEFLLVDALLVLCSGGENRFFLDKLDLSVGAGVDDLDLERANLTALRCEEGLASRGGRVKNGRTGRTSRKSLRTSSSSISPGLIAKTVECSRSLYAEKRVSFDAGGKGNRRERTNRFGPSSSAGASTLAFFAAVAPSSPSLSRFLPFASAVSSMAMAEVEAEGCWAETAEVMNESASC